MAIKATTQKAETSEETKSEEVEQPKTEIKPTRQLTKIEIMKEALAKQPKVSIIIPLEGKEKEGAYETVQLNGYTFQIKKGAYVQVPEQIAKIIMDSQQQTNEAIANAMKRLPDDERMTLDNSQS